MIKFRTASLNIWCYFHLITYYEMWEVVNGSEELFSMFEKKEGE